jgi:hypothetical protein
MYGKSLTFHQESTRTDEAQPRTIGDKASGLAQPFRKSAGKARILLNLVLNNLLWNKWIVAKQQILRL